MDQLIKKTAVICLSEEEFAALTLFRHKDGVHEFFHVSSISSLNAIDGLSNVIYLASAKELPEFISIRESVGTKGVGEKWQ